MGYVSLETREMIKRTRIAWRSGLDVDSLLDNIDMKTSIEIPQLPGQMTTPAVLRESSTVAATR
jgi:hypothetical protein